LSKETAELLIVAGKSHWVMLREDVVEAKGKGRLQTFWLKPKVHSETNGKNRTDNSDEQRPESVHSICDETDIYEKDVRNNLETIEEKEEYEPVVSIQKRRRSGKASEAAFGKSLQRSESWRRSESWQRSDRLVDWNVEVLFNLLKKIVATRSLVTTKPSLAEGNTIALEELKEVMEMPAYNAEAAIKAMTSDSVELHPDVRSQLHDFVQTISSFYLDNPFHNFGKILMTRKVGSKPPVNVISCLLSVITF
jgi:hypothetical protein